jgi:hypothetical protein
VSATSKWNSPPGTEERRGNPRLKVSSLIYAQLGSDNGGIVLNLGLDGLACQTAHNLNANKNSVINLKLRGSGLNAEITGELVWLAGTQKAVGISFKSLSAQVRHDIADWMLRESPPVAQAAPEQIRQEKAISAIADIGVPEKRTVLRSLSAALALSRETSLDHVSSPLEAVNQSEPPLRAEHAAGIFPLAPTFVITPAPENSNPAADQITERIKDQEKHIDSDSPIALESANKNRKTNNLPMNSPAPASEIGQSHIEAKKEIASPPKPVKAPNSVPTQASTQIRNKVTNAKNTAAELIAGSPISPAFRRVHGMMVGRKWIPQAIRSAWGGLNVQRRKLLTHIGAGCIGLSIGLMLVLAVTHSYGSSRRSSDTKPSPQLTVPAVSSDSKTSDLRDGQDQGSTATLANSSGNQFQSNQPTPSMFSKIVDSIFGNNSDEPQKISDRQMGLEVWTSQSTGYYYCSDDPYAKQVQPGSPMLQGDALQAGYRPRLGQFCN